MVTSVLVFRFIRAIFRVTSIKLIDNLLINGRHEPSENAQISLLKNLLALICFQCFISRPVYRILAGAETLLALQQILLLINRNIERLIARSVLILIA